MIFSAASIIPEIIIKGLTNGIPGAALDSERDILILRRSLVYKRGKKGLDGDGTKILTVSLGLRRRRDRRRDRWCRCSR